MASIDQEMKHNFPCEKRRAVANVVFTAHWIQTRFIQFLAPFGLSPQQFNILRILRGAKDWLNMHEVKSRMVEKSPNTTRLCDKLEEKDLLIRKRCESDRRVVFLKISAPGLALLAEIDVADDGSMSTFENNLTDEEARMVSRLMEKIRS